MNDSLAQWVNNAGIIPTLQQTLLIKASTLQSKQSIGYFYQWFASLNINQENIQVNKLSLGLPQVYDQLDIGSQRLLSLLYKNQLDQGNAHVVIQKLQGYYKYVWYRNQLLKNQLHTLLEDLQKIGVEVIIIKGIAQLERYYLHEGTRPTMDIDICIRKGDLVRVSKMLTEKGWYSKEADPDQINQSLVHAHSFANGKTEIDLHHHFSLYPLKNETEELFWNSSSLHHKGYRLLSPAHELYITMLHGYQWNVIPPIRWVADCMSIVSEFSSSDWHNFAELLQSEEYNLFLLLDYLNREQLIPIADSILQQQKSKKMNGLITKQIKYALMPIHLEKFRDLKRIYYRGRYLQKTPIIIHLLKHYRYLWRLDGYFLLIKTGIKKAWVRVTLPPTK